MHRTARGLASIVVGVLAACGAEPTAPSAPNSAVTDDAGAGADASQASLAAASYCESIVGFFCPFYVRCGRMAVADAKECERVFLETCNERFEPRDVALEALGLIRLSARGVDECRAHLENVRCEEQTLDLQGPCARMWTGTSAAGAPCGIDVESFVCEPTTTCVLGLDFCGTCERAAPVGETCGAGVRCSNEAACVAGVCVERGTAGAGCDDTKPCVTGTRCTNGTCVGPVIVKDGEACDNTRRCPYLTSCIGGVCKKSSLLGEPCGPERECASGRCAASQCGSLAADGGDCTTGADCRSALCAKGKCAPLPSACLAR